MVINSYQKCVELLLLNYYLVHIMFIACLFIFVMLCSKKRTSEFEWFQISIVKLL